MGNDLEMALRRYWGRRHDEDALSFALFSHGLADDAGTKAGAIRYMARNGLPFRWPR